MPWPVGQDRLILTRSGSGDPELQKLQASPNYRGAMHGEGQALALRFARQAVG